jgi:hypothetical protein
MIATWLLLFQSRKFWVASVTILAIVSAVALVVAGKVDAAHLTTTIAAITTVGISVIGSIAWEDTTKAKSAALTVSSQAGAEKALFTALEATANADSKDKADEKAKP